MGHAERVFKTVMGGPRENKVGSAQLLEIAQTLEMRGVNDGEKRWRKLVVAVHGIVNDLGTGTIMHDAGVWAAGNQTREVG